MNLPFVSRRRYVRDLAHQERGWQLFVEQAGKNHRDALAQLEMELTASRRATVHLSGQYRQLMETGEPMPMFSGPSRVQHRITRLEWRLEVARKAGRRILAAYTAEKQRADQALGLDTAAVALGASWQDRRQVRMYLDKPTAEEAS